MTVTAATSTAVATLARKRATRQSATFYSQIAGIPCGIVVDSYISVAPHRGSTWACDSDWGHYGYEDFEFTVVGRKGYPAKWLEKKMGKYDVARIQKEYEEILTVYCSIV